MSSCCQNDKLVCEKKTDCQKVDGRTCKTAKICKMQTPEGEIEVECVCTCICELGDCSKCDCKCNCTLENVEKVQTAHGLKYRCECTCKC